MALDISLIKYRVAVTTDLQEIKKLAGEVVINNYTRFMGIDITKNYVDSGQSDKEIEDDIDNMVVAEHDGNILGIVVVIDDLLHLLMVKHSHQGLGIGSSLLELAEKRMFTKYDTITLQTFEGNIPTVEFYEKHGWIIVRKDYMDMIDGNMLKFEKYKKNDR
ncbi:GNAT family N-acetyltransferase [Vallitalea longa]|uniref:GNAT family N-acetyltransferase n=1 Tax=Vallitalea longa TaxID=2936439 RepID=A0A9W5Y9B7_9FIRM|nr:GNAT family N-acetyltransferase [Vallitalea longa]GKX28286.1 GNAT family N-acetyltransferase [Vallitalea longa]